MRSGRNSPCPCGSGLKYKRCCGAEPGPGAALAQLQNAAALIPGLRPRGTEVLAFVGRAAEDLGENDGHVPDAIVDEALLLVDALDRAQIVACFADASPGEWSRIASRGETAERELVGSAIRGAVCDRRPVARTHLVLIEVEEHLPSEVGTRLGLVLPSGAVWGIPDAEAVLPELPPGFLWQRAREPRDGPALERVEDWHADRVRLLCDALVRHLPLPSLPRASRIVGADCQAALADDHQARRVAATLLLSHASWLAASADPQALN